MSSHESWPLDCKVYVGGLSPDATPEELQDAFSKYGVLRKVWVARRPPGFAFLEYEDPRDAEDAVRAMDGARLCGGRVKVEMSSGKRRDRDRRGGGGNRDGGSYRGGGGYRDRDRYNYRRRSRSPRRSRSRSPRRSKSRDRSPENRRSSRSRSPSR